MDIKKEAKKYLNFSFDDVCIKNGDSLKVIKKEGKITLFAPDTVSTLRGFTLIKLNDNKSEYEIEQKRHFESMGVMLDMSRGGVMRPNKVKEFIFRTALCGADMIALYLEDIYVLENYPHFGYMRGAYTDDEIRDIVGFANDLGVKVIPAIQTLGHMAQYLSWAKETKAFCDTRTVMMASKQETLDFVRAEISLAKRLFNTDKIHIGMDEAKDIGLGNYLQENGYKDRYKILTDHLNRVVEICKENGLTPIMWSDMFFRLGSKTGDYYDKDCKIPDGIRGDIPDVSLMYWDYYHNSASHYDMMMSRHKMLSDNISFAGAVCTFRGMFPDFNVTFDCMVPALKSCIKYGVKEVWATMWGDDGTECNYFDALYGFGLFGEYCFCGENASIDTAKSVGALISGIDEPLAASMSAAFLDKYTTPLYWGDVFYNVTGVDYGNGFAESHFKYFGNCTDEFTETVLRILCIKAHIYGKMQRDYKNKEDMRVYSVGVLPILLESLKRAKNLHLERFKEVNKVFGLEVLASRYDTAIGRTEYAINLINDYVENKTDKIEELDYTPLYGECRGRMYNKAAFSRSTDVNL